MPFPEGTDESLVPPEDPPYLASDFLPREAESSDSAASSTSAVPPAKADAEDEDDSLPEFNPDVRQPFQGLLYLGALEKEFYWSGHRFKIKTLTQGELLEVGLITREYQGTLGDSKAYVTAFVAASIVSVDGHRLSSPLGPFESALAANFEYIRDSWYPWVIDAIYNQCLELESRVNDIIEAMGKVPPPSASTAG
jgi:hypothetical protein